MLGRLPAPDWSGGSLAHAKLSCGRARLGARAGAV